MKNALTLALAVLAASAQAQPADYYGSAYKGSVQYVQPYQTYGQQYQPQYQDRGYGYGNGQWAPEYDHRRLREATRFHFEGCVLLLRDGGSRQYSTSSSINLRTLDGIETRGERVTFRSRAGTKTATFYSPEDARVAAIMIQRQWNGCIR